MKQKTAISNLLSTRTIQFPPTKKVFLNLFWASVPKHWRRHQITCNKSGRSSKTTKWFHKTIMLVKHLQLRSILPLPCLFQLWLHVDLLANMCPIPEENLIFPIRSRAKRLTNVVQVDHLLTKHLKSKSSHPTNPIRLGKPLLYRYQYQFLPTLLK